MTGDKRPWSHFAILLITGAAAGLLWLTLRLQNSWLGVFSWGAAVRAAALSLPNWAAVAAAFAAIAAGTSYRRGGLRTIVYLAAFATLLLLVADAVIGPAADRAVREAARVERDAWPLPGGTRGEETIMAQRGAVLTAFALLTGQAGMAARDPYIVAYAIIGVGELLLPFVLIGLMLGVVAWIDSRVMFRTPQDATLARWVMALLIVPLTWHFLGLWTARSFVPLAAGGTPWIMLVPYAPLMVLALLGWRAALRAERGVPDRHAQDPSASEPQRGSS